MVGVLHLDTLFMVCIELPVFIDRWEIMFLLIKDFLPNFGWKIMEAEQLTKTSRAVKWRISRIVSLMIRVQI